MRTLDIQPLILEETDQLIVVNKLPDWPTSGHTLEDDDCIQFHLIRHYGQMIWALQQLDADTSGVCLFTKKHEIINPIKQAWSGADTIKEYLAIVHGSPIWDRHDEKTPIGKIDKNNHGVTADGRHAHSRFIVLDRQPHHALIHVQIFTGRTHQIRIHLSHLGHPLVGEEWYCSPPCTTHPRQALHAWRIQLPNLKIITKKQFTAPLATDLTMLLSSLGLTFNAKIPLNG